MNGYKWSLRMRNWLRWTQYKKIVLETVTEASEPQNWKTSVAISSKSWPQRWREQNENLEFSRSRRSQTRKKEIYPSRSLTFLQSTQLNSSRLSITFFPSSAKKRITNFCRKVAFGGKFFASAADGRYLNPEELRGRAKLLFIAFEGLFFPYP